MRPELDKRRLDKVVDLFANIQMIGHGNSKDILGRTHEYCLPKFAEQEGKLAGEFYTPPCVVRTLVEILQPYSGGSTIWIVVRAVCSYSRQSSSKYSGNINHISVFGQDSNSTTWKMVQMNLAIRGVETIWVN